MNKTMSNPATAEEVTAKVRKLFDSNGKIDRAIAKSVFANCVWWTTSKNGPVLSRKFADRIYDFDGDLRVDFGANTFCLSMAIGNCAIQIEDWCECQVWPPSKRQWSALHHRLSYQLLNMCVLGSNGSRISIYQSPGNGVMSFGAHDLEKRGFIEGIAVAIDLPDLPACCGVRPAQGPPHWPKNQRIRPWNPNQAYFSRRTTS